MSRHMTVRYAEPASDAPWDWTCPWCSGGYTSQAVSDAEALAAATSHAILEHGHVLPAVDVYDRDGNLSQTWGACEDRACSKHYPPGKRVTRDTCERCGGQGCEQCTGPHDDYVPEYVRLSIKRWSKAI